MFAGLAMEDVGMYIICPFGLCIYGYLVYFTAIWYILWPLGVFFPFWYVVPKKSGNPGT
jgi:hypothetical protein